VEGGSNKMANMNREKIYFITAPSIAVIFLISNSLQNNEIS